jgi:hypothetical protein
MALYNLDWDSFAPHLDVAHLAAGTKIAPVTYFCNQDNERELDDKMIHFVVLNVTAGSGLKGVPNLRMQTTASYGAKKSKNMRDVSYNRYWICADLANPPFCFAIITRTSQETSDLLRSTNGDVFIGAEYYIHEPSITLHTVGSTPVLAHSDYKTFMPVRPNNKLSSTVHHMIEPASAGDIKYFILNNTTVEVRRVKPAQSVSCSGIQCDRQKLKAFCTCMHVTNSISLVYSFDLTFHVPMQFDPRGRITINSFRSLRTTKLFFTDFESHAATVSQETQLRLLQWYRTKIGIMVDFINNEVNGGWTIVGWCMKGSTTDAATDNERIDNDHFQVHVCYLYPTEYAAKIYNKAAFADLQIKPQSGPPAAAAPAAVNAQNNTEP